MKMMRASMAVFAALLSVCAGYQVKTTAMNSRVTPAAATKKMMAIPLKQIRTLSTRISHHEMNQYDDDAFNPFLQTSPKIPSVSFEAVAVLIPLLLLMPWQAAEANEYGILAGRTASMIHPLTNFALFATSIYSAYLGLQWRRLREIGEELKVLNNQLTAEQKSAEVYATTTATADVIDSQTLIKSENIKTDLVFLEQKIKELTATRKDLLGANLKDKHYLTGSILLGVGVTVSLLGAFNTYVSGLPSIYNSMF